MEYIICSDLESVYIPETWLCIADALKEDRLRLTTRDVSDYDALMKTRLSVINEKGLRLKDIQEFIKEESPFDGAKEFIDWIRERTQLIIVSDIFKELAYPFMKKFAMPTIFCNTLEVDGDGKITGYRLRQSGAKRMVTLAMKMLNYKVIAFGDSYNDVEMIQEADVGFFFNPSEKIRKEYPEIQVAENFAQAKEILEKYIG